jgi:hypothetical protein
MSPNIYVAMQRYLPPHSIAPTLSAAAVRVASHVTSSIVEHGENFRCDPGSRPELWLCEVNEGLGMSMTSSGRTVQQARRRRQ